MTRDEASQFMNDLVQINFAIETAMQRSLPAKDDGADVAQFKRELVSLTFVIQDRLAKILISQYPEFDPLAEGNFIPVKTA